jgi:tetrahydromethanopterin S-methyltransferase subunit D
LIFELLISLIIGSSLIGVGVHFIPVGGAPAALSTSAGIPTGAPMITVSLGITAILSVITVIDQPEYIMILYGILGSMIMISVIMFFSNIMHAYGVGVPIASSNFEKDPLTGFEQEDYVSPGTKGHGIPTISFVSGIIGSILAGFGGSLAFTSLYTTFTTYMDYPAIVNSTMSTLMALLMFFIVAVIASYNIGGTIQGVYDKKFREKIIPGTFASLLISIVISLLYVFVIWGLIYG